METLAGDNDLEIATPGGVPENLVGTLASLPYAIRISPRIEDFATIAGTRKSLPLIVSTWYRKRPAFPKGILEAGR